MLGVPRGGWKPGWLGTTLPSCHGVGMATHLRKLHARHGDRQCSTQVGMLKMEQRLGSSAVGPPPLIMITLWTRSGYSWARKVQKDTLRGKRDGGHDHTSPVDAAPQGRSQGSMAGPQAAAPRLTRAPLSGAGEPRLNPTAGTEGLSSGFHSCADQSRVLGPAWVPVILDQPHPSDLILPSSEPVSSSLSSQGCSLHCFVSN